MRALRRIQKEDQPSPDRRKAERREASEPDLCRPERRIDAEKIVKEAK